MTEALTTHTTPRHPIAVVVERTGISQDLLRIWERRYGAVNPERGADGKRLYSDRDIERLGLISRATAAGRSVGSVARLPTDQLRQLVDEDQMARARSTRTIAPITSAPNYTARRGRNEAPTSSDGEVGDVGAGDIVSRALTLIKSMDAAQLDEELRHAESTMGVSSFLERVAVPLLHVVGEEWHAGRVTPAQEHLASSLLHDMAVQTMRRFARRNTGARVLVATPAGDRHAIGAALVGAVAAVEGWEVIYVGTDLPANDIASAAQITGARLVALSVVFVDQKERVLSEFRTLRDVLPRTIDVVAGGGGVSRIASELNDIGIRVESSIAGWTSELRHRREVLTGNAAR
jgi:MerR family transcriptional regulator, light-induced transcriptional regulator